MIPDWIAVKEAGRGSIQAPNIKKKKIPSPRTQGTLPGATLLHFLRVVDGEWPSSSWYFAYKVYTYVYIYRPIYSWRHAA